MSVINNIGTLTQTMDDSVLELPLRSQNNLVDRSIEEATTYSPPPPYNMQLSAFPSQPKEVTEALLEGQVNCSGERNTCEGQTRGNNLGTDNLEAKSQSAILYLDKYEKVRHSGRHRWSLGKHDESLLGYSAYTASQIRPIPI